MGTLLPGLLGADLGQLAERDGDLVAAADVVDPPVPALRRPNCGSEQVEEVVDVQHVADLLARAAEADIAQRLVEVVARHPESDTTP